MYVETDYSFNNRIQLVCSPFTGPFIQSGSGTLGNFNPSRDLEVYIDGVLIPVVSFVFDLANNRYLLYTESPINTQGIIQVIHHMPFPPFKDHNNNVLGGFAKIGSYSNEGDGGLPPTAVLVCSPSIALAGTPVTLYWFTVNVPYIKITGGLVNTGIIHTSGSGAYLLDEGVYSTTLFSLVGYNSNMDILLTVTATVGVSGALNGFGQSFGEYFGRNIG